MTRPYTLDTKRLPIAIGYKNESYIADLVMPYFTVNSEKFDWNKYAFQQMYEILETRMSRKGEANEVDFTSTAEVSKVLDEALDTVVPRSDEDYQPDGIDQASLQVEGTTELVALAREKRVSQMVFNTANYDAANVVTLSGSSQFSDLASNPLDTMLEALDVPLVRPNTIVMGQAVWTKTRKHPIIVEAVRGSSNGNAAKNGVINKADLADLLEVQQVLVGLARSNSANAGQTPNLARLWGKHIAMLHLNALGAGQGIMPTWGWTARYKTKFVRTWFEEKKGIHGSDVYRVGEQVREIVSAPGAGYYIANAIA